MSLRPGIKCLHSFVFSRTPNQFVVRTHLRCLKDKPSPKGVINSVEEKDLTKVRVTLKDQHGNIMGIKTMVEAKQLAQKLRLNLIEDHNTSIHFKYKEYKLVSNQFLVQMDKQSDPTPEEASDKSEPKDKSSSVSSQTTNEVKHLIFSTKLNENDLMTKIKQIMRWLSRGHHITINVTNPKNDPKVLESIYKKFETELKGFAKFNQKKIKSNNTLKFIIVPTVDAKEQLKNIASGHHITDDMDMENLDPDKLLSEEFEKELEKK